MRKLQFKKILLSIDTIELKGLTYQETPITLYEEMANEYFTIKLSEMRSIVNFLRTKGILKDTKNGVDLSPAATIYAKSNQNSTIEALAIFETFIKYDSIRDFYKEQLRNNLHIPKQQALSYIDMDSLQLMIQTMLFEVNQEHICFHPKLLKDLSAIVQEYEDIPTLLVSTTLTALYTASIVAHEDLRIDYKNTTKELVHYDHRNTILRIIPRRGVPHDRDETKALQAFYKDTLFHEFDHACPLCSINIPHMLIASHIKPFRDCAHIFEAIDHNNGLLLCRNHDYLFDQGYFTFDDSGYIIISNELLAKENMESSFAVFKNYRLPQEFMTKDRRLFFAYHRTHIFKNAS